MVDMSMTKTILSLAHLTDAALIDEVTRLGADERQATARLVAALAEVDARRLYLGQGCSSLFTYCNRVLRLSEHAAYGRIEAARAGRRFPVVLELLAAGDVTLTTVSLLAPHLTAENHRDVLHGARHRTKREVEEIVAALRPLPDVKAMVRRQPTRPAVQENGRISDCPAAGALPVGETPDAAPTAAAEREETGGVRAALQSTSRPLVKPIAPERLIVRFTISRETSVKLRRAQDLMRHVVPTGDPAVIFDRALTALLEDLEKRRLAATARPRASTTRKPEVRHIPAAVRRVVWTRDGGQCAFSGAKGRCSETGFLEFHHIRPFAAGGAASVENVELRCRAHNQHEAELFFGPLIARERSAWFGCD
jgi:hypothetical protein